MAVGSLIPNRWVSRSGSPPLAWASLRKRFLKPAAGGAGFLMVRLGAGRPDRSRDVIGQQQEPAGPKQPVHLLDGAVFVGDGTQGKRADDGVEGGIWERQRVGVCFAQVHVTAKLVGALLGDGQHFGAQIDPGQPDSGGIKRQVEAGAYGHLQGVTDGLRTDPGPAVAEQDPVEEPHLLVVRRRVPVPVAAPPVAVCLVSRHERSPFLGCGSRSRCPAIVVRTLPPGVLAARPARAWLAWSWSACLPLWRVGRSRGRLAGLLAGGVGVGEQQFLVDDDGGE